MIAAVAAVLAAAVLGAYPGEREFGKQAKITIEKARAIALHTYPGKVVDQELEREPGGSGLRYSFMIRHGSVKHEVGVDARTGKVLKNAVDTGGY